MSNFQKWMAGGAGLLIVAMAVWMGWFRAAGPSRELTQIQAEMVSVQHLPAAERGKAMGDMRTRIQQLDPADRDVLRAEMRRSMEVGMQQRLDQYFTAAPRDRVAMLDKEITAQRQREARRSQQAKTAKASSTGKMAGREGGPPNGPRGGMQKMLDNTSPKFRAQMAEYRRDMNERRRALGLPPSRGPRRG